MLVEILECGPRDGQQMAIEDSKRVAVRTRRTATGVEQCEDWYEDSGRRNRHGLPLYVPVKVREQA